jgi:hypothetical protein
MITLVSSTHLQVFMQYGNADIRWTQTTQQKPTKFLTCSIVLIDLSFAFSAPSFATAARYAWSCLSLSNSPRGPLSTLSTASATSALSSACPLPAYRPATCSASSPVHADKMDSKFDVPGRLTGSYVTPCIESVTAPLNLLCISEVESVRRIREETFGADFDILAVGSLRDRTRLQGAVLV